MVARARRDDRARVSGSRTTWPRLRRSTGCSCPTRSTTRTVDTDVRRRSAHARFSSRAWRASHWLGAGAGAGSTGVQIRIARHHRVRQRSDRAQSRASSRRRAIASVTFFVDGRQVCAAGDTAVCLRVGRRARRRGPSGARGRGAGRRRPHRPDDADQGSALRRQGGGRRGSGHGDGDRRPWQVRRRPATSRVPRVRGRPAADARLLCLGRRAARAHCRGRHQRQHDPGDAAAEACGEEFSRRGARARTR